MPRKVPKTPKPKPPRKKNTGGAETQTLFRKEYVNITANAAKRGFTIVEIAELIGVTERTFYRWVIRHPDLAQALQINRDAANARVELSLYQLATGYERDEEEIKIVNGEVVRVKVRRYYPPNASAGIFWTKAIMGWRDGDPRDKPPLGPVDDGATTIDQTGGDTDKQFARRINFLFEKAQRKLGD